MDGAGSSNLVARWRAGDQQAATELFSRYANRLIALARKRLSDKLAGHIDPEDVVQSVYRSFFADAREGRYAKSRQSASSSIRTSFMPMTPARLARLTSWRWSTWKGPTWLAW